MSEQVKVLVEKLELLITKRIQTSQDVMEICEVREALRKLGYDFKGGKI